MKQYRNLLAVACFSLALHSTALSQWLDEGEFSRGVLAYELRQVKNQFETAEAQLSIRTEVEWNAKKLKLGALYTSIESLETEFRNGGYCPDLLDEEILTVREKIRLILARQRPIDADQNNVGDQTQGAQPGVAACPLGILFAIVMVGGNERSAWQWSAMPPTASAFILLARAMPPMYDHNFGCISVGIEGFRPFVVNT